MHLGGKRPTRGLASFAAAALSGFPDTIKLCQRTDEQAIPRHRRSGHAHFFERVRVQQAKLGTGLEHEGVAVLAQRK